jgi:hypothetical protein
MAASVQYIGRAIFFAYASWHVELLTFKVCLADFLHLARQKIRPTSDRVKTRWKRNFQKRTKAY